MQHPECVASRTPCFSCKMEYWRSGGHSPISIPRGWHDYTVAGMAREVREAAEANGTADEIAPANSRWI